MKRMKVYSILLTAFLLVYPFACINSNNVFSLYQDEPLEINKKDFFTKKKEKSYNKAKTDIFSSDGKDEYFGFPENDEDPLIYAPPPGKEGNPQKLLPVGNMEWISFIIMAIAGIFIMLVNKKYLQKKSENFYI